jgi:hypothetical protein
VSENFIQPNNNPELDKLVFEATSGEDIGANFQALKEMLHQQPTPAIGDSPVPAAANWEFSEEIRWAESTGRRPVIVRAHTAEDLEQLKNQMLYGK